MPITADLPHAVRVAIAPALDGLIDAEIDRWLDSDELTMLVKNRILYRLNGAFQATAATPPATPAAKTTPAAKATPAKATAKPAAATAKATTTAKKPATKKPAAKKAA